MTTRGMRPRSRRSPIISSRSSTTVFDTDEDGEIGPDEFVDFYGVFGLGSNLARRVFVDLDANSDGIITREELLEIGRQFYRSDDPG